VLYEQELLATTSWVAARLGPLGLAACVFIADAITSPFPPDLVLIVVAKSALAASSVWFVPVLGAVSAVAGNVGFLLGRKLGETRLGESFIGRFRTRHLPAVGRYGWIAIVIGALTPVPFSVTCWLAGMLRMRWATVAAVCLLRIPRFILYYWILSHSTTLLRLVS
jgi:membrane protein YqaA with SNARE-associated domain